MSDGSYVQGWKGVCVLCGLATPEARGFTAAVLVTTIAYIFKFPSVSFTDEGKMRPLKVISKDPEATHAHFLAVPIATALLTATFT